MKLSVCCITYNQEKYIAEAIESMLKQQTDFDFEIVIGEDGSSDATSNICEKFRQKYPEKIKLLPNAGNLGMNPNLERTLKACNGEYVAICEGDDYWIDNSKLQQQVDFLEANPDFAICYHRVYELYKNKKLKLEELNTAETEMEYSIEFLARGNCMHTASVVFRNHLIGEFPENFANSPVGDYVLHMLNARHGKIKYLPASMAVYRRQGQGIWNTQTHESCSHKMMEVIDLLIPLFDGEVKETLLKKKATIYCDLAVVEFYRKNVDKATEFLDKAFAIDGSFKELWVREKYPELIKEILNFRKYRVADKAASLLKSFGA